MARCGCSGASCSCVITGSGSVTVTGSGSTASPFVINGGGSMTVTDSATVDLTLTGIGSAANPYTLRADALVSLDELTDVEAAAATTGQVLAKQSDGQWRPSPPSTASPGTITVSGGIEGSGASGNPLSVKLPAGSGLIEDSTGLRVEGSGAWTPYSPVLTTAGNGADPTLGNSALTGRYMRFGNLVFFTVDLEVGTTLKRGLGYWVVSLPVTALSAPSSMTGVNFLMGLYAMGDWPGSAAVMGDNIIRTYTNTSTGKGLQISHSNPPTLPAGSRMLWAGFYEAA